MHGDAGAAAAAMAVSGRTALRLRPGKGGTNTHFRSIVRVGKAADASKYLARGAGAREGGWWVCRFVLQNVFTGSQTEGLSHPSRFLSASSRYRSTSATVLLCCTTREITELLCCP